MEIIQYISGKTDLSGYVPFSDPPTNTSISITGTITSPSIKSYPAYAPSSSGTPCQAAFENVQIGDTLILTAPAGHKYIVTEAVTYNIGSGSATNFTWTNNSVSYLGIWAQATTGITSIPMNCILNPGDTLTINSQRAGVFWIFNYMDIPSTAPIYQVIKNVHGAPFDNLKYDLSRYYSKMSCSADGSVIVGIQTSPNTAIVHVSQDSGATWIFTTLPNSPAFQDCRVSGDGNYIILVSSTSAGSTGRIYVSANKGTSFTQYGSTTIAFITCAINTDGSIMYAAPSTSGLMQVSTNYGVTWSTLANSPSTVYVDMDCTSSGAGIYALTTAANYYSFSTNSGAAWTSNTVPGVAAGRIRVSRTDAHTQVIGGGAPGTTGVKMSTDTGSTWGTVSNYGATVYQIQVAISYDGTGIWIGRAVSGGDMRYSGDSGATWLMKSFSGSGWGNGGLCCGTDGLTSVYAAQSNGNGIYKYNSSYDNMANYIFYTPTAGKKGMPFMGATLSGAMNFTAVARVNNYPTTATTQTLFAWFVKNGSTIDPFTNYNRLGAGIGVSAGTVTNSQALPVFNSGDTLYYITDSPSYNPATPGVFVGALEVYEF